MTRKYGKLLVALAAVCLVTATAANAATVEFRILINGDDLTNYSGAAGTVDVTIQGRTIDSIFATAGGNDYLGSIAVYSINLQDSTGNGLTSVLAPVQGEDFLGDPDGFWASTANASYVTHNVGIANGGPTYDVVQDLGGMSTPPSGANAYQVGGGIFPTGTSTVGNWATLVTGQFTYAGGDATLSIVAVPSGQAVYNNVGSSKTAASTAVITDSVIFGATGPTNTDPTVAISTPDVPESGWSKEPGWNNGLHHVQINAVGTDPDVGDVLTYAWTITKPGGPTVTLDATTASFDLTIQELIDKFGLDQLPPPYASGATPGAEYFWNLGVSVSDGHGGTPGTDSITVFVPEPTTIGLLGFGLVGLIKRRRRA